MSLPPRRGPAARALHSCPAVPPDKLRTRRPTRGYVVIGVLLLCAVLIFEIDVVRDLLRGRIELVALVPDAAAVRVGTPVLLEGIRVGRVTRITFLGANDSTAIALRLRIAGRARLLLRSDSGVRSTRQHIVGQPVVLLSAGHDTAAAIRDGDTLWGRPRVSIDTVRRQARKIRGAVDSLLADKAAIRAILDARTPELRRVDRSLAELSLEARALSRDIRTAPLTDALESGELADRFGALRQRLNGLISALAAARARHASGPPLEADLEQVLVRAAALAAELGELETRFRGGAGVLGRARRDSAIAVAVSRVRAQLDSLMADVGGFALRMLLP